MKRKTRCGKPAKISPTRVPDGDRVARRAEGYLPVFAPGRVTALFPGQHQIRQRATRPSEVLELDFSGCLANRELLPGSARQGKVV